MIPLTHPAKKIDQVDSENKDMGQSYMIQENVNILIKALVKYIDEFFQAQVQVQVSRMYVQYTMDINC